MPLTLPAGGRNAGTQPRTNDVRHVVRSALRSAQHSPVNRRLARDLAWEWVGAKWPRLMPSALDMQNPHYERSVQGQELKVSTSDDGALWTLDVAYNDRASGRTWMTRATVADAGESDIMAVQTSCSDVANSPLVIAPPRLLGTWVERLAFQDGGLAVTGDAREVNDPSQLDAFCKHLLSADRRLPVIALTTSPRSRFYGVDPRGLAEAVRGLAHVACLSSDIAGEVLARFGKDFRLVHGAARVYAAGFSANAALPDHPLIRDTSVRATDPGAFRRLLCQKICAMSVDLELDQRFNAGWLGGKPSFG